MNIREVNAEDLDHQLSEAGSLLLDIREEYEYEDDHLDSLHIPMAEVRTRLHELDGYDKIVVCCKSGNRAQAMAYMLNKNLVDKEISFLKGGLTAYREIYAKD